MRIISGIYKNRKLKSPGDITTHPMGERERNAIFNALGDVTGLTVLDLFAGTGALGLEALSRGAAHVTFVDASAAAINTLKSNTAFLPLASFSIIKADALNLNLKHTPDLVFCDPPYSLAPSINYTFLSKYASAKTQIVLSLPKSSNLEQSDLQILSDRSYAACRIIICRKKNNMV